MTNAKIPDVSTARGEIVSLRDALMAAAPLLRAHNQHLRIGPLIDGIVGLLCRRNDWWAEALREIRDGGTS